MIVMCDLLQYGVKGRMIDELFSFLSKHVNNSFVENMSDFVQVKRTIRKKVQELSAKYPKTKPLFFEGNVDLVYNDGRMTFKREGASTSVISLKVLWVKKYMEGKNHENRT